MSKKSAKNKPESQKTEPVPELDEKAEILCDDKWSCDVIFLIESDVPSNNFINIFQQIKQIQPGIKNITKNEIMKEVKKKGSGKKGSSKSQKKGKGDTPVELTDDQKIMKAVKENTGLPSKPLANIIKRLLINLKINDINERQKLYAEYLQASKKKVKPQSKGSKKGAKKEDKLSDEDKPEEEIYKEKPSLFIIISGFYEYDLPLELLKVDVPIRAIVKLKEPSKITVTDEGIQSKALGVLESEKFNMMWLKFWYMYENLMDIPVNAQYEDDVALIIKQIPDKVNEPNVNAKEKKNIVQNEIISLANYIQMLIEQHKNYLNSTNFYDVPQQDATLEEACLYKTLTEMVPLECTTIPFILFCMLEQVCFWNNEEIHVEPNDPYSQYKRRDSFSSNVACSPVIITNYDENLLKTFHLNIPEINFRKISKNLQSTIPLLKQFKVYPKKNQMEKHFYEFHLQRLWKYVENKKVGFYLFDIYLHWYILCKIKTYLISKFKRKQTDNTCIGSGHTSDARGNELIDKWINELVTHSLVKVVNDDDESTFADKADLGRRSELLNEPESEQNVFVTVEEEKNKYDYKEVKKIKLARKDNLKLLRNFLYCFELLCLKDNKNSHSICNSFKNYLDYQHIEEMTSESLLQVLQESVLNYCHFENFYYPLTNKILVWFHNNICTMCEEKFSIGINTLLGFRDYYNDIILVQELAEMEKLNQQKMQSAGDSFKSNNLKQPQRSGFDSKTSSNERIDKKESENLYFNLGKAKIKLDRNKKQLFAEDGTSVTVETDYWYKSSKTLKISVRKIDTELNIYKNIINDVIDCEVEEKISATLTLPNGIFLNVSMTEKNESPINEHESDSKAKRIFIYDYFSVTVPTGLIIEIIKNKLNNETYVKQSYTNKGPDCNKIWDEKYRCFLKSGTMISFKNDDTVDVIYCNSVKSNIKNIIETLEEEKPAEPEKLSAETTVTSQPSEDKKEKKGKTSSKDKKKRKGAKSEAPEVNEEVTVKKSVYKVSEHSVTSWSGICYEFKDDVCINTIDSNANLRTIFSPYTELFIDRNDGVKSLLTDDGSLVTMYSDGTKLISYFYEEEIEVSLSDENIQNKLYSGLDYQRFESFSSRPSLRTVRSSNLNFNEDKQESIYNFDSEDNKFVSLKLGCIMEHPNYASVEYFPEFGSIKLTLPGNLFVKVHEKSEETSTNIEVTDGKRMKVTFNDDSIEFLSNVYKKKNCLNVTVFKAQSEAYNSEQYSEYFCKTLCSFGYLILVDNKGEVKLINTKEESEPIPKEIFVKTSLAKVPLKESYFDNYIPRKMYNRYFVVNENYSGYEIINKNDIEYFDEADEHKYNNVSVIRNPTNGRIDSITRQHLLYKTCSENYLVPYETGGLLTIPNKFQRYDLGPVWTPRKSPWFLIRSEVVKRYYKRFSYSDISRHNDERIVAVVIKTIQKIIDEGEYNGIDIIAKCLKKYNEENEDVYKKYKNQSFTDFEIDTRLRETHDLICKIKNDFPQWNVIKKNCDECKQNFGQLKKIDEEYETAVSENPERNVKIH